MSIVKKIILVIIILLFSIILYRLFEHRRTIQKNMENNVIEGYSGMNASNPDYSYIKSEVASVAIDSKLLPSGVQNYSSDDNLHLNHLCIKSSWNSAMVGIRCPLRTSEKAS